MPATKSWLREQGLQLARVPADARPQGLQVERGIVRIRARSVPAGDRPRDARGQR